MVSYDMVFRHRGANRKSLDWGTSDFTPFNKVFASRAKVIPHCRYFLSKLHTSHDCCYAPAEKGKPTHTQVSKACHRSQPAHQYRFACFLTRGQAILVGTSSASLCTYACSAMGLTQQLIVTRTTRSSDGLVRCICALQPALGTQSRKCLQAVFSSH